MCGDLNVAHKEIDLKNPKTNRKMQVSLMRNVPSLPLCLSPVLRIRSAIFIQSRKESIHGGLIVFKAREKNSGWRIDYFLTSDSLKDRLKGAHIYTDIFGSDHCPVELTIEL